MPRFFDEQQYAVVQAACARLIPTDEDPGATEAGVVDYIDGFLGAFASDPPLIWAGGPFSGRFGGAPGFATFHRLAPARRARLAHADRRLVGHPRARAARTGDRPPGALPRRASSLSARTSSSSSGEEQDRRLRENREFTLLLYGHACEGMYGAPEYLGNRGLVGWHNIGWDGDVQPRGYTDEEVSQP